MNKLMQDMSFTMKKDVNAQDKLSLGWFNGFLQMSKVTHEASKIKNQFEVNDQFYMAVEEPYLISGFKTFLKAFDIDGMSKDFYGCQDMVLQFLKKSNIDFFFDNVSSRVDKFDDLLEYVKDVSGRTLLSLVFDKMEEESDSLGLHAL